MNRRVVLCILVAILIALIGAFIWTRPASAQSQRNYQLGEYVTITGQGSCQPDGTDAGCWRKPPSSGTGRIVACFDGPFQGLWRINGRYFVWRPLVGGYGWYLPSQLREYQSKLYPPTATPTPKVTSTPDSSKPTPTPFPWSKTPEPPKRQPTCGGPYMEFPHLAYDVCVGDSLSGIAVKCGVSMDVFRHNGAPIANPNYIEAGWHLTYMP